MKAHRTHMNFSKGMQNLNEPRFRSTRPKRRKAQWSERMRARLWPQNVTPKKRTRSKKA